MNVHIGSMLKIGIVLMFVFSYLPVNGNKNCSNINTTDSDGETTKYPILFRDHVFTSLSEKGKEMFFAVVNHPACAKKRGQCIQRGKCIEKKMLYLSRVCYQRDLVCCYDDTIRHPYVGTDPPSTITTPTTATGA